MRRSGAIPGRCAPVSLRYNLATTACRKRYCGVSERYVPLNATSVSPCSRPVSRKLAPVEEVGNRDGWAAITGDTPPARRADIVAAFQAGELKGLALTITAGGLGLTLTRAAHAMFCGLNWMSANNAQADDRLCRIGQTRGCV
jgi:hypothetical protein